MKLKSRLKGFLSEENIDPNSEIFDYIRELHDKLWKFIYLANPCAEGALKNNLESAYNKLALQNNKKYENRN